MSGFCGFAGAMDDGALQKMTESLCKDCASTPIYFSDGYIHLGYVPYNESESMQIGHNDNFTAWAMIESGNGTKNLTPEAVLSAYEDRGISFARELEGTFSIVLWDGARKRLYLLRDRFGAKPLFYAKADNGLAFGTKIKAVLAHEGVNKSINNAAIYQYMSFQSVYAPDTVFENIHHIMPGHYGLYDGQSLEENRYVQIPFGEVAEDDFCKAVDTIDELLKLSVERCTAEEEMGIFLSGGLDSSYVAALGKDWIKYAFCLKPVTARDSIHRKEEDAYFAKELAKQYGIRYYSWEMTPKDLIAGVDDIIRAFSQPFSGTMSTFFLARKVSEICKTVLTGDGADELFGSYRHHSVLPALKHYIACKKQNGDLFFGQKDFAPYENMLPFLDGLYQYGGENETLWYYRLLQMTDTEKDLFLNRDRFGEYIDNKKTLHQIVMWDKQLKSKDVLNRSLERDFYHLLPGHTMLYQETLAENFGVNLKMPFMNRKLVDYVVTLPGEYKIKVGKTKAVLRQAAEKYLPQEIIARRKEPFSLPIVEWLKEELKEYLTDILNEESVKRHGLLNATCVQYALKEFYKYPNQKEYYGQMLWAMAMLERWAFLYM